jgi:hypothetical protein
VIAVCEQESEGQNEGTNEKTTKERRTANENRVGKAEDAFTVERLCTQIMRWFVSPGEVAVEESNEYFAIAFRNLAPVDYLKGAVVLSTRSEAAFAILSTGATAGNPFWFVSPRLAPAQGLGVLCR